MLTGKIIQKLTIDECPWLDEEIKEGTKVYEFTGCTYGCVGDGIAVSFAPDGPFCEVPEYAILWDE